MQLEYSVTFKPPYVEVHVSGEPDYLSTNMMWKKIASACERHECRNILGIANIETRSSEHAYDHAAIFEAAGVTAEFRIAWVETNRDAIDLAKLVEAVIRNRGLAEARVFDDVQKARKWLTKASAVI